MGYGVKPWVAIGIPCFLRVQDLDCQVICGAPPPGRACVRNNRSGYSWSEVAGASKHNQCGV